MVLNYILIPLIGIEGAAIGTLVGYIVSIGDYCNNTNKNGIAKNKL